MNRRKPQKRLAVVPVEEGQGFAEAVLKKAVSAALAMLEQAGQAGAMAAFTAGYLAGYARHQALRHGVDAEQGDPPMAELIALLTSAAPEPLRPHVAALRFSPRAASPRSALKAEPALADAGYLVGHLESLCRTRRLLKLALALQGSADSEAFLTACDVAADPLQTHQPTAALRFDGDEREVVREAFRRQRP